MIIILIMPLNIVVNIQNNEKTLGENYFNKNIKNLKMSIKPKRPKMANMEKWLLFQNLLTNDITFCFN